MDVQLQKRIAHNESLFREANEAILRGLWPGEEERPVRFRCECARVDCNCAVEVTVKEYERVRSHPRRFLIAEGHDVPEVEEVVDNGRDHLVVQKNGRAGAEAEAIDPRG